jgi:hypothetical protein
MAVEDPTIEMKQSSAWVYWYTSHWKRPFKSPAAEHLSIPREVRTHTRLIVPFAIVAPMAGATIVAKSTDPPRRVVAIFRA